MQKITIENITVICTDEEVKLLESALGAVAIWEVTNEPRHDNIDILFKDFNKPLDHTDKRIVCHMVDMEPMTAQEADKYCFDNYKCYFNVVGWVNSFDLIYKEYKGNE